MSRLQELSRWHVEKHLLGVLLRPDQTGLGSIRVADTLLPDGVIGTSWTCYCAGVGEEIRFERHLAEVFKAQVWAFDPTPRSIRFMEQSDHARTRLQFMPVGLWKEDTVLHFTPPENPAHVSHTVMANGTGGFDATCRSVPSLMRELHHETIDLLKMNIEGAEHVVLESIFASGIRPRIITLTWEGDRAMRKAIQWTRRLRREGYAYFGRIGWFYTYVRHDAQSRIAHP